MSSFPIDYVRTQFPALEAARGFVFFDNAAGAQAPRVVLDTVQDHLLRRNVQRGGRYRASEEVDAAIARARQSVADLLNAREPEEVAFGMNATSFVRLVSLAIGDTLGDRREIITTDLDHEANVATWLALARAGAVIRWWPVRDDGRLHVDDLARLLTNRTRLVAVTLASNAIGSRVDGRAVCAAAHAVGAEVFFDAVHYGPHGRIDVEDLDADYLVCSGYKIFAPHMGFLWGRRPALDALPTFREHFIPDRAPFKFEVGTYVYENVAGMDAAVGYLAELGIRVGAPADNRRAALTAAMEAIRRYEHALSRRFLERVGALPPVRIVGLADPADCERRVPTFCLTVEGRSPAEVARGLAVRGFGVRDGHMYAPRLMRRLGLPEDVGAVRASLVHYNTAEEIDRFTDALAEVAR